PARNGPARMRALISISSDSDGARSRRRRVTIVRGLIEGNGHREVSDDRDVCADALLTAGSRDPVELARERVPVTSANANTSTSGQPATTCEASTPARSSTRSTTAGNQPARASDLEQRRRVWLDLPSTA